MTESSAKVSKKCLNCLKSFHSYRSANRKFCSLSCSMVGNTNAHNIDWGDKKYSKEIKRRVARASGENNFFYGKLGSLSQNWKGGFFIASNGYVMKTMNGLGSVAYHRFIMERYLGRKLLREEFVHHKNGDKKDNRIENLEVMTNSQHMKLHRSQEKIKREMRNN